MKNGPNILSSKYWWLLLLLILIGVNYLASVFHARFDLTKEKRYTLSKVTRSHVKKLDDQVQIDVFLKGDFPAKFRKLTNSVREFLGLLKESNSRALSYRLISPDDIIPGKGGMTYGDSLVNMGASPINLKAQVKTGESSSLAFPYAIMKYKGKEELITLFTVPPLMSGNETPEEVINNAEALLEFQFVKALDKITTNIKPGIGYSIGNGEPVDQRTWDLRTILKNEYTVKVVDLNTVTRVPDSVEVLMIVKPTLQFTEEEKLTIDQFVMRGGKLLCFIDNLIAEADSLSLKPETIAYDRNLNLTDLFFRYGVRINTDLVMDLQCDAIPFVVGGTVDNPQMDFLRFNYFPFLVPGNSLLMKNTGYVSGHFVNSMDTINVPGVRKETLLVSSPNSRIIKTPALISLNENKNVPEDSKFKMNAIPVAMLLKGKFTSLFKNRIGQSQKDSLIAHGSGYRESSGENQMIIVADGDMVLNDYIFPNGPNSPPEPLPMGWNKYTYTEFVKKSDFAKYFIRAANREFLMNAIESLVSNPELSKIRNKEIVLRQLDGKKVRAQRSTWQLINIALPVLLVILCGWIYQEVRKRKYGQ